MSACAGKGRYSLWVPRERGPKSSTQQLSGLS